MVSGLSGWSSFDGWPTAIKSDDGCVTVGCKRPRSGVSQAEWVEALSVAFESLRSFQRTGVDGHLAIASVLNSLPPLIAEENGIEAIWYLDGSVPRQLTRWPEVTRPLARADSVPLHCQSLPFAAHPWAAMDVYRGNYTPEANIAFFIRDAVLVRGVGAVHTWFVLLEAYAGDRNDAILQKTAFVNTRAERSFDVHESSAVFENAGGGGPYDLILEDLVVSARGDVIASVAQGEPDDHVLGHGSNLLIRLNTDSFDARHEALFTAPSVELVPLQRDVDVEVMKYFKRFPEHVTEIPGRTFEKIVAEVLKSQGFSDIQMNVRSIFGEFDIVAFNKLDGARRKGYIIECKRYKRSRKVSLREAHVLAQKLNLMASSGVDRAMLVTTSDFTAPTRRLYDSAWGLELKAYDELVDWLRHYKINRDERFF